MTIKRSSIHFQQTILISSLLAISVVLFFIFTKPIAQQEHYHAFSRGLNLFGISNFWNVVSNLPFVIIGAFGLIWWGNLIKLFKKNLIGFSIKWIGLESILFIGLISIGFGSAYYHYSPSTSTLFWDRLPMALVFSVLFVIILRDFVSAIWSKKIQLPIIVTSILSVVYWLISEHLGRGDLRPYILVQFLPMLLIPYFLYLNKYEKKQNLFGYPWVSTF